MSGAVRQVSQGLAADVRLMLSWGRHLGAVARLDVIHRQLWDLGYRGLGTTSDLAVRLREEGFKVEAVDGDFWVFIS